MFSKRNILIYNSTIDSLIIGSIDDLRLGLSFQMSRAEVVDQSLANWVWFFVFDGLLCLDLELAGVYGELGVSNYEGVTLMDLLLVDLSQEGLRGV
jgi:hypothetical protein